MEKGKFAGSYFLFLIREGLIRLKRELWGWRGLAAAFMVFYLVIDLFGAMESDRSTMGQGMAVIWMVVLFPPRMGKLLYLLPFYVFVYISGISDIRLFINRSRSMSDIRVFVFRVVENLLVFYRTFFGDVQWDNGIYGSGAKGAEGFLLLGNAVLLCRRDFS